MAPRPLQKVAAAFEKLANAVNGNPLDVASFSRACLLVSPLIDSLGNAFRVYKGEFEQKIKDIRRARARTLQGMIQADIGAGTATTVGSHTQNLLAVKRTLHVIVVLFEQVIPVEGDTSLDGPARAAYQQVFAAYHPQYVRDLVTQQLDGLPTKDDFICTYNENESSARIQMDRYIDSATTVVQYVENLFVENGLDLDN